MSEKLELQVSQYIRKKNQNRLIKNFHTELADAAIKRTLTRYHT